MPKFEVIEDVPEWQQQFGPRFEEVEEPADVKARAEGAALPTWRRSLATSIQGPLFGFADEIVGGLEGLRSMASGGEFDPAYLAGREKYRGAVESFRGEYPASAMIGQIGGGMLLGPATASVGFTPATAAGAAGRAATVGAGYGALGGAGEAQTLGEVPGMALMGAGTGGAFGGATQAAPAVVGAVGRAVSAGRGSPKSAERIASQRILEAIRQDDMSVRDVGRRLASLGEGASIAQAGGANLRNLLDTYANMPGMTRQRAEQFVRNEIATRGERLRGAAEKAIGARRLLPSLDDWQTQKVTQAAPLFQEIQDIPVAVNSDIARLTSRPVMREAVEFAKVAAANRDEVLPDIAAGQQIPFRYLKTIKEGLDDLIAAKKRSAEGTGSSASKTTLRDALETKRELVKYLDDATGGKYKQALDAYAGPSALQDAAEEGTKSWTKKAREIEEMMRTMSASEKEAYRIGVFEGLRDKLGTMSGQNQVLNLWREDATRERLKELFGDYKSFNKFAKAVLREGKRKEIERTVGGSSTAMRQAGQQQEAGDIASELVGAAASPRDTAGLLNRAFQMYGRAAIPEPVRNEVGRMLLMTRGGQQDAAQELARLQMLQQQLEARRRGTSTGAGLLGGLLAP